MFFVEKVNVKAAFPNVYNNPQITFDNYVAYAWKSAGLQGSYAFDFTFNTPDKIDQMNQARNLLEQLTTVGCQ